MMNKFVILSIAFASLAGIGILGTIIVVQVQDLADFATLSEMPDSKCVCPNADGSIFGSEFCEDFTGEIKDPPRGELVDGLCKTIAPNADYGSPTLGVQGCGVGFWITQTGDRASPSDVWPSGYVPDYYYNDMFHTTFELSTFGLNDNKVIDDDKVRSDSEVTAESEDVEESEVTAESEDVEEVEVTTESEETEVTTESEDVEESEVTAESELTEERQIALRPQPVAIGSERIITEDDDSEITAESEDVEESEVTAESEDVEEVELTTESEETEVTNESELTEERQIAPIPQPVAKEVERIITEDDEKDHGPTLLQALHLSGENLNELIRESVAAILNSAHSEVDYPFTVSEIMSMTQIAIANEDYSETAKSFREVNDKNNSPICLSFTGAPSP